LRKAADGGKLQGIRGFGPKIVQKILAEAKGLNGETRTKLIVAEEIANSLVDWLKGTRTIRQIEIAGSVRRGKETVGDLDILATCEDSGEVMNCFVNYEEVKEVTSHGSTRSSVKLRSGINVDLRIVPDESFGAALHYFTGSKTAQHCRSHAGREARSQGERIRRFQRRKANRRANGAGNLRAGRPAIHRA
jgi:DNA polymerase (family X)